MNDPDEPGTQGPEVDADPEPHVSYTGPERRLTDRIRLDRQVDEAPRQALEMVRADKLSRSIELLEAIRNMCLVLLVVLFLSGVGVVYIFDYMGDNRTRIDNLKTEIDASTTATGRVEKAFDKFSADNQLYLNNHEHTQRLICDLYRAQRMPLPDNGDCDNR